MKIKSLAVVALLALSGCATLSSPVSVSLSSPPGSLPQDAIVMVVPEPGEVDWSAEQALRATAQPIAALSPWRLRVSERPVVRAFPSTNFSCHAHRWSGYYPWGYGGWYHDPWCDRQDRITVSRTVTWILEDQSGRVWWQASAREPSSNQPPARASLQLAQALAAWRSPQGIAH